jgi:hypothetical protein
MNHDKWLNRRARRLTLCDECYDVIVVTCHVTNANTFFWVLTFDHWHLARAQLGARRDAVLWVHVVLPDGYP